MWDVSDVKDDVVEHVKVISTTMKKTVSSQFRTRADDTESTPLLQVVVDNHQNEDYTSSIQVFLNFVAIIGLYLWTMENKLIKPLFSFLFF